MRNNLITIYGRNAPNEYLNNGLINNMSKLKKVYCEHEWIQGAEYWHNETGENYDYLLPKPMKYHPEWQTNCYVCKKCLESTVTIEKTNKENDMKEIVRDIPGDKVKLTKNSPPIPTNVKITYGDNGQLLRIIFQYGNERYDGKEILEWIRQYAETVIGKPLPPKETLVFDGEFLIEGQTHHVFNEEFKFEDRMLCVFNMMLKNVEFHDIDDVDSEFVLDMEMGYEYFRWDK